MPIHDVFARHPLARGSLHASCEDGWLVLIDDCLTQLEAFGQPIDVLRIGEKMGVLQIRIATPSGLPRDAQRQWEDIIHAAEEASLETCDVCGNAGRLRQSTTGTYATRCDEHKEI